MLEEILEDGSKKTVIGGRVLYDIKEIVNLLYPIGSYYITESSLLDTIEKMNNYFGGTWEKIEGRFLLGASEGYIVGSTGGEAEHTLILSEIPSHNHGLYVPPAQYAGDWASGFYTGGYIPKQMSGNYVDEHGTTFSGSGQPHNNMPPYRAVYIYKRIG